MNRIFFALTILCFNLYSNLAFTQSQCEDLFKYRDNQLINDYDAAFKQYDINKGKLEKFKNQKKELEGISFGKTAKTIGEIAISVEAACKLSKEILSVIPAAKVISKADEIGFFTVDIIQKKFIEGKTGKEIIIEIAEKKAAKELLGELYPAYKASAAIQDYYEKIKEMKEFSKEAGDYLDQVKEQMKTYEDAITKYQAAVDEQKSKIDQINEIKNAIDKYCGDKPVIEVTTNLDCKFSIDMGDQILLLKDDKKELNVEKGEHILIAKSTEKGLLYNTKFNILENQANAAPVKISFPTENNLTTNDVEGKWEFTCVEYYIHLTHDDKVYEAEQNEIYAKESDAGRKQIGSKNICTIKTNENVIYAQFGVETNPFKKLEGNKYIYLIDEYHSYTLIVEKDQIRMEYDYKIVAPAGFWSYRYVYIGIKIKQ
jgi:hypothetical protein